MKQWTASTLVLFAFGYASTTLLGGEINLLSDAVVLDAEVYVTDVAELCGFDEASRERLTHLVLAADLGADGTIRITQDVVRRALVDTSINRARLILKGAAACQVRRVVVDSPVATAPAPAGVPLPPGRSLREAVVAFVGQQMGIPDASPVVRFGHTDRALLDLREPAFSFAIRQTSGRRLGMIGLEITVTSEDSASRRFPLLVEVSAQRGVLVAARTINLGATLQPADLHTVTMAFTNLQAGGVTDAAAVLGQRARRFIPAGEMIALRDLEPVPLVHRGQFVEIRSQVGRVTITSAAKASQEGAFGDTIELHTGPRGGHRVSGVIRGPGRVVVGHPVRTGDEILVAVGSKP